MKKALVVDRGSLIDRRSDLIFSINILWTNIISVTGFAIRCSCHEYENYDCARETAMRAQLSWSSNASD